MVTMVYAPPVDIVEIKYLRMIGRDRLFVGPKSFVSWENAVAYALLPADPNMTVTPRRRVRRGSSGRWIVTQTHAAPPRPGRGHVCVEGCAPNAHIAFEGRRAFEARRGGA